MKHVELEQFLHAFTSRGFDSVSWAFLLMKLAITWWSEPFFLCAIWPAAV